MDHYTPMERQYKICEKLSGKLAKVIGIPRNVALGLMAMEKEDWVAIGFDEAKAAEIAYGFFKARDLMYAEKLNISPLHPEIKVLANDDERRLGDTDVVVLEYHESK